MKNLRINGQNRVFAQDYCAGVAVFLEIVNLRAGSITIKASVSGDSFENIKNGDEDMVFVAGESVMQASLPKGRYFIMAEGSNDVNEDVIIKLQ